MENWRTKIFWVVLGVVALEFCFFIGFFVRDGQARHAAAGLGPIAMNAGSPTQAAFSPEPPPTQAPPTQPPATHAPATGAPATSAPTVAPSPEPTPTPEATPSPAPPTPTPTLYPTPKAKPVMHVVYADPSEFRYEGHWEHVTGRSDGRVGGKSSRTFSRGARATLSFHGRFVRLYGILGPGGGFGAVQVDRAPYRVIDFFAASKTAHRLVYASAMLPPGSHHLTLAVVPDPKISGARTQYVNIDGAEYGS